MKVKTILPALLAAALLTGCTVAVDIPEAPLASEVIAPEPTPEPTPSPDEIYAQALELLYRCDFEAALPIFESLGDVQNSVNYAALCRERIELIENPPAHGYFDRCTVGRNNGEGTLYASDSGVFYVPNECNEETKTFIMHPGGNPGDRNLPLDKIEAYFKANKPNALMYFYLDSGMTVFESKCGPSIDILKSIAAEKGFVAHDVVIFGASSGCYPALHGAAMYYKDYGMTVSCAVLLDAGNEWESRYARMSEEEMTTLREQGTKLYFFEQPKVGMDKPAIAELVNNGLDITIVECRDMAHDRIAYNAFRPGYNVFDFALGYIDESGLKEGEYKFVKLEPETASDNKQ